MNCSAIACVAHDPSVMTPQADHPHPGHSLYCPYGQSAHDKKPARNRCVAVPSRLVVCARWCPTLPHPGGCSTIGAVRLSFRVRDGYRAFPCRCDHRDDYMGSAGPSSLVRLFGYWFALQRTLCVCWWCGLGVDRIVDARVYRIAHPPPHVVCGVWGCCCLCWPISTSQLTDRCRSSTSGLSTQ